MIHSMTGYGKASTDFKGKKITVEIRALNSKGLDLSMRMSSAYRQSEMEWRKILSENLERGKIDVSIQTENFSAGNDASGSLGVVDSVMSSVVNKQLAESYYEELKSLAITMNSEPKDYLSLILKMPDIYTSSKEETSVEEIEIVGDLLTEAIVDFQNFRKKEGAELEKEFTQSILAIEKLLLEVPQFEGERIEKIRERMVKAFEDLSNVPIDNNRLEQELIYWVEKFDVNEEKMRLANHLTYFMETMKAETSGKKLGFITQEIGREINTLGSKSYHVDMQKIVVLMKDYLERIKEQILNTL